MYYVEMKVLVQLLARMAGLRKRLTPADIEAVVLEATLNEVTYEMEPGMWFDCYLVGSSANRSADAIWWDAKHRTIRVLWRIGHVRDHGRTRLASHIEEANVWFQSHMAELAERENDGDISFAPRDTAHWLSMVADCQRRITAAEADTWRTSHVAYELKCMAREIGSFRPDIRRAINGAISIIDGNEVSPTQWQQPTFWQRVKQYLTEVPASANEAFKGEIAA